MRERVTLAEAGEAHVSTSSRDTPAVKVSMSFCNTILPLVSVPVLSEHSMFMPATSSMEARRVTMAFSSASEREPRAMVEVETTGSAIGIEATSSTTQNTSALRNSVLRFISTPNAAHRWALALLARYGGHWAVPRGYGESPYKTAASLQSARSQAR